MNESPRDQDLEQRFQSLKYEDSRRALAFENVLDKQQGFRRTFNPKRLRWITLGSLGLAFAVYLGVAQRPEPSSPEFWEIPALDWATPTDFLLETPELEWATPTDFLLKTPALEWAAPTDFLLETPGAGVGYTDGFPFGNRRLLPHSGRSSPSLHYS